ncbi:hypothetical protein EUV02_11995 [Polymorphobacter arshaanensis]|uniref:Uncharacterized protein n=1 Tax=Glacieibacterium arshaanense TaxID=2511025 RepID=A0A4Y9EJV0_9SPHN|nr:hypothetical protein [Polymorphobacter arshaanensis]TFU01033.1 hypothetical protein EUV02_11995 [Polymorphobacter arshaanensis]
MGTRLQSYLKRAVGVAASLAIGLTVVAINNTVWAVSQDFPLTELWGEATLFQVMTASSPFLVLSIFGISACRSWIVGLSLTVALWGYYLWDTTHYKGGGANIGLGILLLFSPVPITIASLAALATYGNRRAADGVDADR